jgi:hypothetical protein
VVALEEGVDDGEDLPPLLGRELFDLLEAVKDRPRLDASSTSVGGRVVDEAIDGDAKGVGELSEDVARRESIAALVVSDHAAREAGLLLEGELGETARAA